MKILLLSLLLCLSTIRLSAQNEPAAYILEDGYNFWNKQVGDTAYIFSDIAYIRDYPGIKGRLLDSLTQETPLIVKSENYNNTKVKGFEAPWYKVAYVKDGKKKEGFIWAGLLSLGRQQNKLGDVFSYGFLRFEKETSYSPAAYMMEVKCFDHNGSLKAKDYYPAELSEQRYSELKILPDMGLSGLSNVIRIAFFGEACGIPTYHYYFSWNSKEIIPMFSRYDVGDAGIFYHEEKILFPSEHKLDANLIIKDIEEGEVIDENAQDYQYKKIRKREKFMWDGKVVSQLMEMKPIK